MQGSAKAWLLFPCSLFGGPTDWIQHFPSCTFSALSFYRGDHPQVYLWRYQGTIAILKHAWLRHTVHLSLLIMKPFQTFQPGLFQCTPANLMAPIALCSWCYHLSHAGCVSVLLCLPCEQKLGASTIGIWVIFLFSPYPVHSSYSVKSYWMIHQIILENINYFFRHCFCLTNNYLSLSPWMSICYFKVLFVGLQPCPQYVK